MLTDATPTHRRAFLAATVGALGAAVANALGRPQPVNAGTASNHKVIEEKPQARTRPEERGF